MIPKPAGEKKDAVPAFPRKSHTFLVKDED